MKQEKKVNSYLRGIKISLCNWRRDWWSDRGDSLCVTVTRSCGERRLGITADPKSAGSNPGYYFCSDRDIGGTLFP